MDAKELRIGNLVKVLGIDAIYEVDEITDITVHLKGALQCTTTALQPIPLTADLLEKCKGWHYINSELTLQIEKDGVYMEQYSEGASLLKHIKHLHQLQNLVHDLTGEELAVNL